MTADLRISVVVPTYRRPEHLNRCLEGLAGQTRPPEEIVVVRRSDDEGARLVLSRHANPRLNSVSVSEGGVLAAMRAGVERATGDVVAFTDDDAVPRRDWLEKISQLLADRSVGAVGGRDVVYPPGDVPLPRTPNVGGITPWGRVIGNHHLGIGAPRDVRVLKAVNMAFRKDAVRLPSSLRGAGAQAHFEVAICLWAQRRGWRLVYDPALVVDHYVAPRFDADQRGSPETTAVRAAAYNLVFCLLGTAPSLYWRRAVYGLLVGDRGAPGLTRAIVASLTGEWTIVRHLMPSLEGQLQALVDIARGQRPIADLPTRAEPPPSKRRPRVLLVLHDLGPVGGMERACTELVRRGSSEFEFTILSGTLSDQLRGVVSWSRIPLIQRPFPLKFLVFYGAAAFRIARRHADLIHTMGAIVPNRVDLATIHYCHAGFHRLTGRLAPQEAPLLRRANTAFGRLLAIIAERWSYRPSRTSRLAAVSPGVAAELGQHYPNIPVHVTPNGVDTERFTRNWPGRSRFREVAQARDEDIVALFVGGDWTRKGLALAIQAVALAERQVDRRMHLWVVGQGDQGRFREIARDCGIADHVQFFGRRSDAERFYQSADIFILPTIYETFSLAAYEAACCGLPVVATRVSGIEELVGANEAGILVERTPDAIAAALRRLALDGNARLRMGQVGSSKAKTFTWQRSADAVLGVYRELLAQKSILPTTDRARRRESGRTGAGW